MKLQEIKGDQDLATLLVTLLEDVSHSNMSKRESSMSKLYFLLKETKFPFELANKKYKIGRIIPINANGIKELQDDKFTVAFYSNMVVPHFEIESNPEKQVEKLIAAGVGGIIQHHDDYTNTEVRDNFKVVAYEVPSSMVDIQLSISDVLENLGLEKDHKRLYDKAKREKEILAINKADHDYHMKLSDLICVGRKSSGGYVRVSKDLDILKGY